MAPLLPVQWRTNYWNVCFQIFDGFNNMVFMWEQKNISFFSGRRLSRRPDPENKHAGTSKYFDMTFFSRLVRPLQIFFARTPPYSYTLESPFGKKSVPLNSSTNYQFVFINIKFLLSSGFPYTMIHLLIWFSLLMLLFMTLRSWFLMYFTATFRRSLLMDRLHWHLLKETMIKLRRQPWQVFLP